jgi:TonB family protein
MTSSLAAVLLLASWAVVLPGAAAGQAFAPGTAPSLDRRVFVDVNAVAPGKVLDQLCGTIACTLDVDPRLPQNDVSLKLSNVRARTALDALCDIVGCRWSLKGSVLSVVATSPPPAVPHEQKWLERMKTPLGDPSWRLQRVPLRDVLARLSRHIDTEIVWEGVDLDTPVSEDLTGRNAFGALVRLQSALGYKDASMSVGISFSGSANKILISPPRQPSPPPVPAAEQAEIHDSREAGLTLPKVVTEVKPRYTPETRRAGIEGVVILLAVVNVDGKVGEVTVLQSLEPRLDTQAVSAAKQWVFEPGTKDGKPVPVRVTIELTFTLK